MAVYIDLNPVRAGMVDDPGEYRWCGYAEGMGGGRQSREGLAVVVGAVLGRDVVPQRVMAEYRMQLYGRGESKGIGEDNRPIRRGVSEERVREVLETGGRLDAWETMGCRVRYFSDGLVLGSRAFVEDFFEKHRWRFGKKREDGARGMRYVSLPGLFTVRDLQKAPIG